MSAGVRWVGDWRKIPGQSKAKEIHPGEARGSREPPPRPVEPCRPRPESRGNDQLLKMALRIRARAIQREAEILNAIELGQGARDDPAAVARGIYGMGVPGPWGPPCPANPGLTPGRMSG